MKLKHYHFFIGLALVYLLVGISLLSTEKIQLQLSIHQLLHSSELDTIMCYLTYLGDGLLIAIIGTCLFLFKDKMVGAFILISYLVSAAITQTLKLLVFPEAYRPIHYLRNHPDVYFIKDFTYHEFHSFPSGHSTSIFALATILVIYYGQRASTQYLILALSLIGAFSRVYLNQHFLIDVFFGSLIGTGTALLINRVLYSKFMNHRTAQIQKWTKK